MQDVTATAMATVATATTDSNKILPLQKLALT